MFGNKQKNKAGKKAGSRSPVKRRSTSKRPSRKGRKIFASIAEEKDWDTEVPGLRISRAFGVVLIVHVIAVLGLLIHAMGNKSNTPNSPVDEAQHETLPEIGGYGKGNLAVSESSNLSSETSAAVVTVSPSTATPNESAAINTAPETVASTAAIAPEPRVESYRIISGDSLYGIAKRLGVPLEDLVRANGLDTGQEIYPGQKLYIPSKQIGKRKMEQARQLLTQEMSKYQAMAPP